MNKSLVFARGIFAAALLLLLSGCVAAIGNREPARSTATLGQELVDLKKARDAGAVSEVEYAAQREKLLGKR